MQNCEIYFRVQTKFMNVIAGNENVDQSIVTWQGGMVEGVAIQEHI
jgi:hypothetical protein